MFEAILEIVWIFRDLKQLVEMPAKAKSPFLKHLNIKEGHTSYFTLKVLNYEWLFFSNIQSSAGELGREKNSCTYICI